MPLNKTYTKEELQQLHDTLYEILAEVSRVCEKLKIHFFLTGGSVIGAKFWQGIIAWDDDIDIGMKREDYEIFLREAPKILQKKYFLPQLIGSANTMKLAIEHLEPLLEKKDSGEDMPTLVIATVEGDIHDIGKNLVVLMLKNYGYNVIDMGKDVPCEDIVNKAIETNAAVIGLSALMTTTMMRMKDVVEICKEKGCKSKVVIGGACITQSVADEIGADGYSKDAAECVKLVERLLNS